MATDNEFINLIYKVARQVKGADLSDTEKSEIIDKFNAMKGTTAFNRAKKAIEDTLGEEIEDEIFFEAAGGALNNLQQLILQLQATAKQWEATKKK